MVTYEPNAAFVGHVFVTDFGGNLRKSPHFFYRLYKFDTSDTPGEPGTANARCARYSRRARYIRHARRSLHLQLRCTTPLLRPHCTQHLYPHCPHTAPDTYTPDTRYLCPDRVMRMPRLGRADCSLSAFVSGVSVPMLRSFCVNARLSRIRAPRPVPRLGPSMLTLAPSVPPGLSASVPRPFGAYTSAAPCSFSCQGMAQSASATGSRIHTSGVTRRVKPQPLSAAHSFIGSRGKP